MYIGILFNLFFKFIVMLAKLRLPQPFHGYVKTFQWWLIAAQLCAIDGYLIFPPPPPPEPDSTRRIIHWVLDKFFVTMLVVYYIDLGFSMLLCQGNLILDLRIVFLHLVNEPRSRRIRLLTAKHRRMLLCLVICGLSTPTHARLTLSHFTRAMSPSKNSSPLDPNAQPYVKTEGTTGDTGVQQLAALLAQALSSIGNQQPTTAASNSTSVPVEAGVILTSGVGFRSKGPRSDKELEQTRILVTHAQRQELQAKPESLKKLRDRICVALPHVIQEIKWSDILDESTDSDLSSAMIKVKTMMDDVQEFASSYDLAYVCDIPLVRNLWDDSELAQCGEFKSLLTDYTLFDEQYIRTYQHVVNVHGFSVDVESSRWLQTVLEKSMEPTLLVRVKQRLASFLANERGGLTMFYIVTQMVAKPSHEFIESGQTWIKNFKLSRFPGEHVPTANSRIKAVVEALSVSYGALPPNTVDKYLEGMTHTSCDEFKTLVQSLIGSYNNPVDRIKQRFTIQQTLDLFATSLEEKFTALTIDKKWNGESVKVSIFKTDTHNQGHTPDNRRRYQGDGPRGGDRDRKHKYPSREAWFDAQTCGTCGKNHPTWAHDDPVGKRSGSAKPLSRPKKTFSRNKLNRRVREAVHNTLLEAQGNNQDELEEEHYVNMAGATEFESLDHEEGSVGGANDDDELDSDGDVEGISALVAAALGNLVKD
jgi:hypothetical protein